MIKTSKMSKGRFLNMSGYLSYGWKVIVKCLRMTERGVEGDSERLGFRLPIILGDDQSLHYFNPC